MAWSRCTGGPWVGLSCALAAACSPPDQVFVRPLGCPLVHVRSMSLPQPIEVEAVYDFGEDAIVSGRSRDGWRAFLVRSAEGRSHDLAGKWDRDTYLPTAGTTLDGTRFVWSALRVEVFMASTGTSAFLSDARLAALRRAQTVVKPGISPEGWLAVDGLAAELYDSAGERLRQFSMYQAGFRMSGPMIIDPSGELLGVGGEAANLLMSNSGVELAAMPSAIDDLGLIEDNGVVIVSLPRGGGGVSVVETNGLRTFNFDPSEPFREAPLRWARVHPAGLVFGDGSGSLAFVTATGQVCPTVNVHPPIGPERLSKAGYRTVLGSCVRPGCHWRRMVVVTSTNEVYFITPVE